MGRKKVKDRNELDLDVVFGWRTNVPARTLYLYDEINESAAARLEIGLDLLKTSNPSLPVLIKLNTYGGGVYDGLAVFDIIKNSGLETRIVGSGAVMSMGAIVLQAGTKRFLTKNSTLMIHEPRAWLGDEQLSKIKIEANETERLHKIMCQILADRSGRPAKFFKRIEKDRFFTAEEALTYNLIDGIVGNDGEKV